MGYLAFHTRNPEAYMQRLEKLAEQGFNVISAGMLENSVIHCFEWWAILEKKPADIELKELKEPKDEAAELLETARKIKEYCDKTDCCDCLFLTAYDGSCELCSNAPHCWGLKERE